MVFKYNMKKIHLSRSISNVYYGCYRHTFASSFKESELSMASLTTGTSWGIVNTALALECSSCRESSPENVEYLQVD